jgi:PPOX class probable F420-dependent enzyme
LRGDAVLADAVVSELLAARLVAVMATLEPDGAVHAVPLWFAVIDDGVVFATNAASRKVSNLLRDARATVVLHDSRPGFEVCGASLRGRAEVVTGTAAKPLIAAVHRRYVRPAGLALAEAHAFLSGDDVALVFRPEAAFTWDERTNPATAALRQIDGGLPLVPTTPRP